VTKKTESLVLDNLHCTDCARHIEETLAKTNGVHEAQVLVGSGKVQVCYDARVLDHQHLVAQLDRLGHRVIHQDTDHKPWWQKPDAYLTAISGVLLGVGLTFQLSGFDAELAQWGGWTLTGSGVFYLLAVGFGGGPALQSAYRALRERRFGINILMTIAILGAVAIGELVEAASLAFLYALAELLEQYAVDRGRRSLRELLSLTPQQASVLRADRATPVAASQVQIGDTVVVRPGEKVPLDGTVIWGDSAVNQAPITGEAVPIEKTKGDPVYAGSLNEVGVLHVRVDKHADDSTLARIIHLVEQAEAQKAPTERLMERFGQVYTPMVVGLATLVVVIPTVLFAQPLAPWLLRALTLLVLSCPCALLISTPVSVVSAITAAARNGVLIKGGTHLEAMGQVRAVAFDKTGTLTTGEPQVQHVIPLDGHSRAEVLYLAASLESHSAHPIARAIVRAANGIALEQVERFASLTGQGVEGCIKGKRYRVGKRALFPNLPPEVFAQLEGAATSVVVGDKNRAYGLITVADPIRPDAAATVSALKALDLEVVMLTGDRGDIAKAVARQLGIAHYRASVLPEQKLQAIQRLQAKYGHVAMVGDGINDAPALAAATVGVAMGAAGSDTALETADIALLADDLSKLPYLVCLSRQSRRVIKQNVAFSIALKLALSLGVLPGAVTLVGAVVFGDMGTTLAVTGNAMRLARLQPSQQKKSA